MKIVNSLMPLTILTKCSILDVRLGCKNATKSFNTSFSVFNIFSFSSHLVKYFFSFYFVNFFFCQYSKKIFKFCCTRLIFIQTNIYVKTFHKFSQVCKFLFVAKIKQWCLIISKEIFIILI